MNSNFHKKSTIFIFITAILVVVFISACQQAPSSDSEPERTQAREPKTSFGHNIKRTKDLSEDLSRRDDQIAEQAEEVFEQ